MLQEAARTDPLTGLFNRRYLYEMICYEKTRSDKNKHTISFILGDIDNFKKINDTYGHDPGRLAESGYNKISQMLKTVDDS